MDWIASEYEESEELVAGRPPVGEYVAPGERCFDGTWTCWVRMGALLLTFRPFSVCISVFGGTGGPTEDALVLVLDELSLLAVDETDAWGECPRPNALLAASLRFHFVVTAGSGSAVIGFGRTPGEVCS
jgi:hypothetical protein